MIGAAYDSHVGIGVLSLLGAGLYCLQDWRLRHTVTVLSVWSFLTVQAALFGLVPFLVRLAPLWILAVLHSALACYDVSCAAWAAGATLAVRSPVGGWFLAWFFALLTKYACTVGGAGPTKFIQGLSSQSRNLQRDYYRRVRFLLRRCDPHTRSMDELMERLPVHVRPRVLQLFPKPIGVGSCAQVHLALVQDTDGRPRVMCFKFVAPRLRDSLDVSFGIMRPFVSLMTDLRIIKKHKKLVLGFLDNVKTSVLQETDMLRQCQDQLLAFERFRRRSHKVQVPEPYPEWSGPHVLAMEYVPMVEMEEAVEVLRDKPDQIAELARSAVGFFKDFTFGDERLHPDMHKGNVMVNVSHPDGAKLVVMDYGICMRPGKEQLQDFAQFAAAFLCADSLAIGNWFVKHMLNDADDTRVVTTNLPLSQHMQRAVQAIAEETVGRGTTAPYWPSCANRLMIVQEEYNLHLTDVADNLYLSLLHLQGIVEALLPHENAIRWLQDESMPYSRDLQVHIDDLREQLPGAVIPERIVSLRESQEESDTRAARRAVLEKRRAQQAAVAANQTTLPPSRSPTSAAPAPASTPAAASTPTPASVPAPTPSPDSVQEAPTQ